jgi:hypothetical protein
MRTEKKILNREPIGQGEEKIFFENPDKPNEIIGFYKDKSSSLSARQIRGSFYLQQILHIIYPGNIPEIHLRASKPPEFKVQLVELGGNDADLKKILNKLYDSTISINEAKKITQLANELDRDPNKKALAEKLRLVLKRSMLDDSAGNFGYDKKTKKINYIEEDYTPWIVNKKRIFSRYKETNLTRQINKIPDPRLKEKALAYLERLKQLKKEEEIELNNAEQAA